MLLDGHFNYQNTFLCKLKLQIHRVKRRLSSTPQYHLLPRTKNDPHQAGVPAINAYIISYAAIFIDDHVFNITPVAMPSLGRLLSALCVISARFHNSHFPSCSSLQWCCPGQCGCGYHHTIFNPAGIDDTALCN